MSDALNVGKTYGYRVAAFNTVGSTMSNPVSKHDAGRPTDDTHEPEGLWDHVALRDVDLGDIADNEVGFLIERQTVNPRISWTVGPGRCSNERRVRAPHHLGFGLLDRHFGHAVERVQLPGGGVQPRGHLWVSVPPVTATTPVDPPTSRAHSPAAVGFTQVNLSLGRFDGSPSGYNVYRSTAAGVWAPRSSPPPGTSSTTRPWLAAYPTTTPCTPITPVVSPPCRSPRRRPRRRARRRPSRVSSPTPRSR